MIRAVIFDMFETLISHYRCPTYFSAEMAQDAGIKWEDFYKTWKQTDGERTLGRMTFAQVIERILKENSVWSRETFHKILKKRTDTKKELFRHLDDQIIQMLEELKSRGLKVGLISNCFDEEAVVIEESVLAKYFDGLYLSCRLGLRKPEPEIFNRCMTDFGVAAGECMYCGDGGSGELEAASGLGMNAVQALWYFPGIPPELCERKPQFPGLQRPIDLIRLLDSRNIQE